MLIGALALRVMDVRSPADLRERMQSAVQPLGDTFRESMSPVKESMQVRLSSRISIQPPRSKYHARTGRYTESVLLHFCRISEQDR